MIGIYSGKRFAFLHSSIANPRRILNLGGLMNLRKKQIKNKLTRIKRWKRTLFPWLVKERSYEQSCRMQRDEHRASFD